MRLLTIATGALSSLALLAAAGLVATRTLVGVARRRAPALGRFVTVDGVCLHLRNEGEGPTVLLIHGAKGSLYDYELELAPLLRSRYRVITVDRPGSGYSERVRGGDVRGRGGDVRGLDGGAPRAGEPRLDGGSSRENGSPFVQADLLHGLLRELRAAPAIVLGHSAGAPVALALALRHPDDVAALVTAAGYTHAVRPLGTPLARLLRARLLGRLFRAVLLAPAAALVGPLVLRRITAPERAPRAYARAALALNYDPARSAGDAEDVTAIERDLRLLAPEYPRITQPLIAVHGREDRVLWPQQSERLVDAVPGAELRPIADAGHLLPVTRAADLAAAIDDVAAHAARGCSTRAAGDGAPDTA
jgi:pimeloyl-ACP methyl ester carboxylesterase